MMGQDRAKHEFSQTENVQFKLDSTAILIEGKGMSQGKVIHNALAVVRFDKTNNQYSFQSFLQNGREGNCKAELIDGKMCWYPSDNMRYIISINENGQWFEIGEINMQNNWYQFFEMTLNKE